MGKKKQKPEVSRDTASALLAEHEACLGELAEALATVASLRVDFDASLASHDRLQEAFDKLEVRQSAEIEGLNVLIKAAEAELLAAREMNDDKERQLENYRAQAASDARKIKDLEQDHFRIRKANTDAQIRANALWESNRGLERVLAQFGIVAGSEESLGDALKAGVTTFANLADEASQALFCWRLACFLLAGLSAVLLSILFLAR